MTSFQYLLQRGRSPGYFRALKIARFGDILVQGAARPDRAPLRSLSIRWMVSCLSQRGTVSPRSDPAGPCVVGREAWGVGREQNGQQSVKPQGGTGADRKAPEQSQIAWVLVVDRLLLGTNEGGIERKNKPDSRPAGRGAGREESGQRSGDTECEERDVTPHASRPNDVGGQPGFPGAGRWVAASALSADLWAGWGKTP